MTRTPLRRSLRPALLVLLPTALLGAGLSLGLGLGPSAGAAAAKHYAVPRNGKMENQLGVRVSALKLVGDGGIVQLDYVVLDSAKAQKFVDDVANPPKIEDSSHAKKGRAVRTAVMKQGHDLRSGQTYYIFYQNENSAIRRGDTATLTYDAFTIAGVPVE